MKYFAISLLLISISCSNWLLTLEKADDIHLKTLDFVIRNSADTTISEVAPGDTVLLYAYFTGPSVTSIEWNVSYNIYKDLFGSDTAYDYQPLTYTDIPPDTTGFTTKTTAIGIKFIIPDSIMNISSSVDDELIKQLGFTKADLLNIINALLSVPQEQWETNPTTAPIITQYGDEIFQVLALLSVPIRVYATVNGIFNIKSDINVRYNRLFKPLPNVFVNHNPDIKFIGIQKMSKNLIHFTPDSMGSRDSTYILYLSDSANILSYGKNFIYSDTITIDKDYYYYINCYNGTAGTRDDRDTCANTLTGSTDMEEYYSQWFYKLKSDEEDAVTNKDNLMIINNSANFFDELLPALDTVITTSTIWCQLYDFFLGDRNRSSASALKETQIYFRYTAAYKDYLKTKK